ncbi:DUF4040 domain-containing protein [Bacillaceae bacterium SIJ1]|nr:DUF4040 domain-containing protein [Litoribacterium kuwaitense]
MHVAIVLPLMYALFAGLFARWKRTIHTGWFILPLPALLFIYFISILPGVSQAPLFASLHWIPSLNINFDVYADGLALLFSLLITGIGSLVILYSIFYLHTSEKLGHFYTYLLIFMSAMLGIVLSDNLFVLYTFWELTSISSFLLIGFWNHRDKARYGAQKSLLITVAGGLSMLGAFFMLSHVTGTSSIRTLLLQTETILEHPLFPVMLILILFGAFAKSAQFPFHIWLPDAMEAPTPVSAYLHSATMVKAGLYLVARFSMAFTPSDLFFILVTGVGLLTLCWGSYLALKQTDLKAILAYSTISQLGMIMAMLGFGSSTAILGAVFHIFNHATFKGSLFMVAGIIDHETGTRDIRRLRGLLTFMPITATLTLIATFSMAGVPMPILNGFLSKEMFFTAATELAKEGSLQAAVAPYVPIFAVFGSIFTFAYSMFLFFRPFTGSKDEADFPNKPHEAPAGMLISPSILVALVIVIGLFPNLIAGVLLAPATESILGGKAVTDIYFWHGFFNLPFLLSCLVATAGILVYFFRKRLDGMYRILPGKASGNRLFDGLVYSLEAGSSRVNGRIMTGSLTDYFQIILVFFVGVVGYTIVEKMPLDFMSSQLASVEWYEWLILLVIGLSAIVTLFIHHRIALILVIGVTGYGVALLFVMFRAPDLALTQLVIETVTVALFLLCFAHMPRLEKPGKKAPIRKILQIVLSVGVGVIVAVTGISSFRFGDQFEKISAYFLETSYTLGGGKNVVNTILVDMRGLDTMLEIAVLGLAAIGIYVMIKVRDREELK